MSDIKRLVETHYANWLNNDSSVDLTFYASKANEDSQFPLGVVRVAEAEEIIPGSSAFRIDEVQVLIITSIDQSTAEEQSDLVESVRNSLNSSTDMINGNLEVLGRSAVFQLEGTSQDEEKYADVIQFSMGVKRRS
tara:strand:+ start:13693 stop:14100 length:408 start_codon:yes stop_codon:yes gene_type:complete